jgi:hypothetical protein
VEGGRSPTDTCSARRCRISVAFFRISVAFCRISVAFRRISVAFCRIFRIFVSSLAGHYRIYHMPLRAFSREPTVAFFAFSRRTCPAFRRTCPAFRGTCPAFRGMPAAARKKRRAKNEKWESPCFWFFVLPHTAPCVQVHMILCAHDEAYPAKLRTSRTF